MSKKSGDPNGEPLSGSAIVNVVVYPWGDDDAVVNVRSCCVRHIELLPDLLECLLRKTFKLTFGAFTIGNDGDINVEHNIVGSTLDKDELAASVRAVSFTAYRYDNEIVRRWDGMTALQEAIEL